MDAGLAIAIGMWLAPLVGFALLLWHYGISNVDEDTPSTDSFDEVRVYDRDGGSVL